MLRQVSQRRRAAVSRVERESAPAPCASARVTREGARRLVAPRLIWLGALAALVVVCAVVYVPVLEPIFGTAPFPPANWLFLLV